MPMGAVLVAACLFAGPADALTEAEIRAAIVEQSRRAYFEDGKPCPCPYDVKGNGEACADWSAHTKRCGAEPFCYPEDVTAEDIATYRAGEMPSRDGRRSDDCAAEVKPATAPRPGR